MNILIGQNHLNSIGGSETFIYTLINSLKKYKGLNIDLITGNKRGGIFADKIKHDFDITVNILNYNKYDIAIINHNSTMNRIYKENISINKIYQYCHGIYPSLEQPYINNNLNIEYISISKEIQNYLLNTYKLNSTLIHNGVDINRFFFVEKMNDIPKNFLSLSQSKDFNQILEKALDKLDYNYNLTTFNKFVNPVFNIENYIKNADIVFSLGRGVYESMSMGKSVIIADKRPYSKSYMDGIIKNDNISNYIKNNCSGRYTKKNVTIENLLEEIKKYNINDGIFNRKYILNNHNMDEHVKYFLKN